MRHILGVICMVFLLAVLSACSGDVETEIVGSWRANSSEFTFSADKTFVHRSFSPPSKFRGIYEIVDGDKLKLNYSKYSSIDVVHEVSISGDSMKLTNGDGKSARFKRLPDEPKQEAN